MKKEIGPYKIASTIVAAIFFLVMVLMFTGTMKVSPILLFLGAPVAIILWLVLNHMSNKRKKKKHPEEYEGKEGSFWKSPDGGISAKGLGALILAIFGSMLLLVFLFG